MNRLNLLLTLSSINVVLVTIERFSFTTKILLQPYNFLRLHEVFQMLTLILFSVLIPFFVLKEVTRNFDSLKTSRGLIAATFFITGVYFYATGNGLHELASFLFNTFCPTTYFESTFCRGTFFNDYYFGNILYFAGALLINIPLIYFETRKPRPASISRRELIILVVNSLVYALAIFAYAGFDRVLVGLVYAIIGTLIVDYFLLTSKVKYGQIPFTLYGAIAYTLGTIASLLIRIR